MGRTGVEPRKQYLTVSLGEAGAHAQRGSAAGTKAGSMGERGGFRAPDNCSGDSDMEWAAQESGVPREPRGKQRSAPGRMRCVNR